MYAAIEANLLLEGDLGGGGRLHCRLGGLNYRLGNLRFWLLWCLDSNVQWLHR